MTTPRRGFQKGQSGNPRGRPKGARHKTTLAMEAILEGEAEALTRKAIELANNGEATALRLCLDRLLPVRKDRHIRFALPPIDTPADLPKATAALIAAVAAGEITPSEAAELGRLVEAHGKAIEIHDHEARIRAIEEGKP